MSGTRNDLIPFAGPAELVNLSVRLPAIFLADSKSTERFWEFFVANIRNRNTRRTYYKAACRSNDWCEGRGPFDLGKVKPIHVAAYIRMCSARTLSPR